MNIAQLAEICGVSPKTVSRVINDEPNVRSETRERVLAAMKKHKYRPNVFARNMHRKRAKTLLVSVVRSRRFSNTIWIEQLLKEVVIEGQQAGFRVLMESYVGEFDEANTAMAEGGLIDAVIVFYEQPEDPRIRLARDFGIPAVVFGRSLSDISYVANKNASAMVEAYTHLFSRKLYRSVLLLGNKHGTNLDRAKGARDAYRTNGVHSELLTVRWGANSEEEVKEIVSADIESDALPDVYFVSGDQKALGVYAALHERGLRIPDAVSVVGFDDISISRFLAPPLTTMAQDFPGLARSLVETVHRMAAGDTEVLGTEVPARLVVRKSTR